MLNFLKSLLSAVMQIAAAYFAGMQSEKNREMKRERDQAVDQAKRIANRADDAGELSKHFSKRADNEKL